MRRIATVIVLAVLAGGCARTGTQSQSGSKLDVVASFYPIAEAVERIGASGVRVRNLTPPGVEPHDLEFDSDDIDAVTDADVLIYLGAGFQPALEDVIGSAAGEQLDLLSGQKLMEGAEGDEHAEEEAGHEDEEYALDPHVWLDPQLWSKMPARIASALAKVDPRRASEYRARAQRYASEIEALDEEFAEALGNCKRKLLVTNHAAFGYLAERYGLEQGAISGVSPEAEPDPDHLAELADLVEREGVRTIFTETLVSPDVAETLARETGVDVMTLNPLEGLTPEEIDGGASYRSTMRANLRVLRDGLGCG